MPDLLALPAELILEIFKCLDSIASGNFRLACRSVNVIIQPVWNRQFAERQHGVTIEHQRLETLVAIAENPKVSVLVRKMCISNIVYPRPPARSPADEIYPMGGPFQGFLPTNVLRSSGEASRLLIQAFQSFKNLQTIRIVNILTVATNSELEEWDERVLHTSEETKESPVPLVLLALAEAGARPMEIYIEDGDDDSKSLEHRTRWPVSQYTFTAPPRSRLPDVLNGLTLLNLGLRFSKKLDGTLVQENIETAIEISIRTFMSHLTSLNTLKLSFDQDQSLATRLLKSIGDVNKVGDGLHKLKILDLSHASAPVKTFSACCSRFQLDELRLAHPIILYDRLGSRENHWREFLNTLSHDLVANSGYIKRLRVSHAAQWPADRLNRLRIGSKLKPVYIMFKGEGREREARLFHAIRTPVQDTKPPFRWLNWLANHAYINETEWRKVGL